MCSFSMFNSFIKANKNILWFRLFANVDSANQSGPKVFEIFGIYMATPLGFEPRITPPKGAVLPLHHGVRDPQFRFANFASGAIPKVYSHSAEAVGDPEIMIFPMQTPSNSPPKSRLNQSRRSQIVACAAADE